MTRRYFLILSSLILHLLSFTQTHAQDKEDWINVDISLHVWQKAQLGDDALPLHKGLYYRRGNDYTEISAREGSRVDGIRYRGPALFSLFRQETKEGETIYVPVASIKLQPSWKQVMMYLFPEKDSYKLSALDISGLMDQKGTIVIVNFTRNTMSVQLGADKPKTIKPNGQLKVDISKLKNYRLPLVISVYDGKNWQKVYSRVSAASPEESYLAYLYQPPTSTAQYRFFIERGLKKLEPEKPELAQ